LKIVLSLLKRKEGNFAGISGRAYRRIFGHE
jgi:hypothetical protein